MSNEFKAEIVNFPTEHTLDGRAVQLYLGSNPFSEDAIPVLVFGKGERVYHSIVLEGFLTEKGLSFAEIRVRDVMVPALRGDHYKVVGMGRVLAWPEDNLVVIGGESQYYNLGVDQGHLGKIIELGLVPEGWELQYQDI